jgi:hypothetical protein
MKTRPFDNAAFWTAQKDSGAPSHRNPFTGSAVCAVNGPHRRRSIVIRFSIANANKIFRRAARRTVMIRIFTRPIRTGDIYR